jgi:hypothetical protein
VAKEGGGLILSGLFVFSCKLTIGQCDFTKRFRVCHGLAFLSIFFDGFAPELLHELLVHDGGLITRIQDHVVGGLFLWEH